MRFAYRTLSGMIALALATPAVADNAETTMVVTGSQGSSELPAWTNSATKSAVAESKTPQVINTIRRKKLPNVTPTRSMKFCAMRRASRRKCAAAPAT